MKPSTYRCLHKLWLWTNILEPFIGVHMLMCVATLWDSLFIFWRVDCRSLWLNHPQHHCGMVCSTSCPPTSYEYEYEYEGEAAFECKIRGNSGEENMISINHLYKYPFRAHTLFICSKNSWHKRVCRCALRYGGSSQPYSFHLSVRQASTPVKR